MTRIEKLLHVLTNSHWRKAWLQHSVAASAEHRSALTDLVECRTVVDIGANRGQFALAAYHCLPSAQIISFEPLPKPSQTFQRIFANCHRVRLYNAAISPQRGEVTVHISQRDDSSSLLPITSLQNQLFSGTAEVGTTTAESGPLSAFVAAEQILSPALLKLDVQGFELQALEGCNELLSCFSHVYVECSFVELYAGQALADEVIAWLRERGFALRGVYNMVYEANGKAVQADFLFVSRANGSERL